MPFGPLHRARNRIHLHSREDGMIVERLEDARGEQACKVELANETVRERQPKLEAAEVLGISDPGGRLTTSA
jgi:hypothetical protein